MIDPNAPIALMDSTPAEWLENLFDRASIFMSMQCREPLKIVASQLQRGYLWFLENHDPIALLFLELLGVVNKSIWGVLDEL